MKEEGVLALIETSGESCSLGLYDLRTDAFYEHTLAPPVDHSRDLPFLFRRLLDISGFPPETIRIVAITEGPGSFTGLRLGLAFARGWLMGTPSPRLIGISLFEILWYASRRKHLPASSGELLVVVPAHRRSGYTLKMDRTRPPDPLPVNALRDSIQIHSWEEIAESIRKNSIPAVVPCPVPKVLRLLEKEGWVTGVIPGARDMLIPSLHRLQKGMEMELYVAPPSYIYPYKPHKPVFLHELAEHSTKNSRTSHPDGGR